jgi:hypothetical protein
MDEIISASFFSGSIVTYLLRKFPIIQLHVDQNLCCSM